MESALNADVNNEKTDTVNDEKLKDIVIDEKNDEVVIAEILKKLTNDVHIINEENKKEIVDKEEPSTANNNEETNRADEPSNDQHSIEEENVAEEEEYLPANTDYDLVFECDFSDISNGGGDADVNGEYDTPVSLVFDDQVVKNSRKTCYNCLGSHVLSECKEPLNQKDISANRRCFENHQLRMHLTAFKPGVISPEVLSALGIGWNQYPPWIYRMRKAGLIKGYPPGYLMKIIEPEILEFFTGDNFEKEDKQKEIKTNPDKIVWYDGFNAIDKKCKAEKKLKKIQKYPSFTQEEYIKKLSDFAVLVHKKEIKDEEFDYEEVSTEYQTEVSFDVRDEDPKIEETCRKIDQRLAEIEGDRKQLRVYDDDFPDRKIAKNKTVSRKTQTDPCLVISGEMLAEYQEFLDYKASLAKSKKETLNLIDHGVEIHDEFVDEQIIKELFIGKNMNGTTSNKSQKDKKSQPATLNKRNLSKEKSSIAKKLIEQIVNSNAKRPVTPKEQPDALKGRNSSTEKPGPSSKLSNKRNLSKEKPSTPKKQPDTTVKGRNSSSEKPEPSSKLSNKRNLSKEKPATPKKQIEPNGVNLNAKRPVTPKKQTDATKERNPSIEKPSNTLPNPQEIAEVRPEIEIRPTPLRNKRKLSYKRKKKFQGSTSYADIFSDNSG